MDTPESLLERTRRIEKLLITREATEDGSATTYSVAEILAIPEAIEKACELEEILAAARAKAAAAGESG